MSTYEKIALVVIGALFVLMSVFSYHEYKEPPENVRVERPISHFDASYGQTFQIGSYAHVQWSDVSGGPEENCAPWKPVIVATLHDIKERLEQGMLPDIFDGSRDIFMINEKTLELFCNKHATIVLSDENGNRLLLEKTPFARMVPPESAPGDIGTLVHIDATVILAGTATSTTPTTSGDILIPDRLLDPATTTKSSN